MVTVGPVADDEVAAGAGRPLAANASFARQPARSLHYSNNYPEPGSYIATTTPTPSPSSLPPLPSSSSTSYWASNYPSSSSSPMQQQQYHHPWLQLQQHAAPASSSSSLAHAGLQPSSNDDEHWLASMSAHCSRQLPALAPCFAQPQQPQVQMQFAMQAFPTHHQFMAAAPVEAVVPLIAVDVAATGPRRRGRPRKNTGAASSPNRPAPRRKTSASSSAATSTSREARQPAAQATNNAVAVATTSGQTVPCIITNPTALLPEQEQCQVMQSTSSNDPCAWEEEAWMMEERIEPYADTTVPGVRFQPTSEEIIGYLRMKYLGHRLPVDFIKDCNVYQAHPETITG